MRHAYVSVASAILIAFGGVDASASQENRKITGQPSTAVQLVHNVATSASASAIVRVDEAFAGRYGFAVPAPFSLTLPDSADIIANVQLPDQLDGVYARISFSSLAEGQFETLDVTPLRIETGRSAQRRQIMSQLFITRVFADLTSRYINKRLEGVNLYLLPGYDSVVLNGTYWDPKAGDIAVRIYGVMPQDNENGLLFYERRVVDRAGDAERHAESVVRSVVFD